MSIVNVTYFVNQWLNPNYQASNKRLLILMFFEKSSVFDHTNGQLVPKSTFGVRTTKRQSQFLAIRVLHTEGCVSIVIFVIFLTKLRGDSFIQSKFLKNSREVVFFWKNTPLSIF
jgi:hypothetical protein